MNPWVIGWIASDGHNDGGNWSISQNIDDADALYIIREMIPNVGLRITSDNTNRYGTKPMVIIWEYNKKICDELTIYGVPIGDKTVSVEFPRCFSDTDMWLYIRGVLEGDGSIGIDSEGHPRIQITISRLWCDACKEWLNLRGISSYVVDEKGSEGVSSIVIHNVGGAKKFLELVYLGDRDKRMGRKFALAMKVLLLIEFGEIQSRKSSTINERNEIIIKIKNIIKTTNQSAVAIAKNLNCSCNLVLKVVHEELGTRSKRNQTKVVAAEELLRKGMTRTEVMKKMGIGLKTINKAYRNIVGNIQEYNERNRKIKIQKIIEMILCNKSVEYISNNLKCSAALVISLKRKLYMEGKNIKLNKTKKSQMLIATTIS